MKAEYKAGYLGGFRDHHLRCPSASLWPCAPFNPENNPCLICPSWHLRCRIPNKQLTILGNRHVLNNVEADRTLPPNLAVLTSAHLIRCFLLLPVLAFIGPVCLSVIAILVTVFVTLLRK